ncbi:universal stress protein [Micromonospora cremea]|uniref:universal stress protein n=1 Tax=Micromonospora cremea TaxID=709881 RepID=UPI003CC7CAB7
MNQVAEHDRRIVVGVDGSPGSRAALRWAVTQAELTDARVEAVSAWQDPAVYGFASGWSPAVFEESASPRSPRRSSRSRSRTRPGMPHPSRS